MPQQTYYVGHILDIVDVPFLEWLVEVLCVEKHGTHRCHVRNIPFLDGSIEIRCAIEDSLHGGNFRDIPRHASSSLSNIVHPANIRSILVTCEGFQHLKSSSKNLMFSKAPEKSVTCETSQQPIMGPYGDDSGFVPHFWTARRKAFPVISGGTCLFFLFLLLLLFAVCCCCSFVVLLFCCFVVLLFSCLVV